MPIVDVHFHVLATNDLADCNLSTRARFEGVSGWLAGALLGMLDEELLELVYPKGRVRVTSELIRRRLLSEVRNATEIDGVVLLCLDAIADQDGKVQPSDVCVSEEAVLLAIQQGAGDKKLYLGASVHPNRVDAGERLERAKNHGAVLVKWVPSTQRIDPANPAYDAYYKKLADLDLPLLCHVGPEASLPDNASDERFNVPNRLVHALDLGVTVIFAHGASHFLPKPLWGRNDGDYTDQLIQMVNAAPGRGWKVYSDISAALITPYRAKRIGHLLNSVPEDRLVYGSDFPIFTHDLSLGEIGRKLNGELATRAFLKTNLLDKDVLSKKAVGIPASIFENTAKVLKLMG
jgi:hypothetical protein